VQTLFLPKFKGAQIDNAIGECYEWKHVFSFCVKRP
jgi:hypothetical protein